MSISRFVRCFILLFKCSTKETVDRESSSRLSIFVAFNIFEIFVSPEYKFSKNASTHINSGHEAHCHVDAHQVPYFQKTIILTYFPKSPTISATLILDDSKMELSPRKQIQPCLPIMRVAAKALSDKNIPVVEYGQQVRWRHGDPMVLFVSSKTF